MQSKFPHSTTPGIDGEIRSAFAANIEERILDISKQVRCGEYQFSSLKPIAITKEDGGIRLINVPTIRDRFVQRVILKFFKDNYSTKWLLPNSFSSLGLDLGIDKEGVHTTLKLIQRRIGYSDWVVRADLSNFFDTIDRMKMRQFIKSSVRHRSFHKIIFDAIECETATNLPIYYSTFERSGLVQGEGIRQGMPISPVLAYLYLADIDRKFGNKVFRYVDDLIFVNSTKAEVLADFQLYNKYVKERGLTIHPMGAANGKTVLLAPKTSFNFLGLCLERRRVGNSFSIPSATKTKIEKGLLEKSKYPTNRKDQKGWLISASLRTSGLIRDYATAYSICEDWNSFQTNLKQHRLAMCRSIAKEVFSLTKGDKEDLLRAFGVED